VEEVMSCGIWPLSTGVNFDFFEHANVGLTLVS
jgi:hypothetical protein